MGRKIFSEDPGSTVDYVASKISWNSILPDWHHVEFRG